MFLLRTPILHLPFCSLAVRLLVAYCVLLAAAQAQEAILHDGQPALMFRADPDRTITADLVDHDGERALRFPVLHQHSHFSSKACKGYLYVSRNHVAYDPVFTPKFEKDAFDLARNDVKRAQIATNTLHDDVVAIWSAKQRYIFYALFDSGAFGQESSGPVYQFIVHSLNDFDNTLHEAETLTASLAQQTHPAQEQVSQAKEPSEPASGTAPVELKEGQTTEEVEKVLGKPQDTITLKENLIYVYPTVKVIFEKGKLVDVQYPENSSPK